VLSASTNRLTRSWSPSIGDFQCIYKNHTRRTKYTVATPLLTHEPISVQCRRETRSPVRTSSPSSPLKRERPLMRIINQRNTRATTYSMQHALPPSVKRPSAFPISSLPQIRCATRICGPRDISRDDAPNNEAPVVCPCCPRGRQIFRPDEAETRRRVGAHPRSAGCAVVCCRAAQSARRLRPWAVAGPCSRRSGRSPREARPGWPRRLQGGGKGVGLAPGRGLDLLW